MASPSLTPSNSRQEAVFAALCQSKDAQQSILPSALLLQGSLEPSMQASPLDFGWALAAAALCEQPQPDRSACTHCTACKLMLAKTHPDFFFLASQSVCLETEWPLLDSKSKSSKPSKEIIVEHVLQSIGFTQRSAARSRGKVVLIYPAERMNAVSANALLKTLEEPPEGVFFILASLAPHLLLPTIRSRCQFLRLDSPLLADLSTSAPEPSTIPLALWQNQAGAFAKLSPKEIVQQCLRLCHDLMCIRNGAKPRFFRSQDLPPDLAPSMQALVRWHKLLMQAMQSIEHPYREGLFKAYLLTQAQRALASGGK